MQNTSALPGLQETRQPKCLLLPPGSACWSGMVPCSPYPSGTAYPPPLRVWCDGLPMSKSTRQIAKQHLFSLFILEMPVPFELFCFRGRRQNTLALPDLLETRLPKCLSESSTWLLWLGICSNAIFATFLGLLVLWVVIWFAIWWPGDLPGGSDCISFFLKCFWR